MASTPPPDVDGRRGPLSRRGQRLALVACAACRSAACRSTEGVLSVVDLPELQVSRSIVVAAPPERVYEIVSDVTRIGELSPVCKAAWWDERSGPEEGSRPGDGSWFTGRNEMAGRDPWERHCEVIVADPGRAFGWVTGGRAEGAAEWTYRFQPVQGGTEVEEAWRIIRLNERLSALSDEAMYGLRANTESGIEATLENLKKVAEA